MAHSEPIYPSCNISTVTDKRGGIFTWVCPDTPIVEFNMLYFTPQASRGEHFHSEFTEIFLVVEGEGIMVSIDTETKERHVLHMAKGSCVKNRPLVPHAFHAISPVTAIAMLTKEWDRSEPPITRYEVSE